MLNNYAITMSDTAITPFIKKELSYSTGLIEHTSFFDNLWAVASIELPGEELTKQTILRVVNGEMFVLEDSPMPGSPAPLTEQSGLFKIIGLADQPNP